MNIAILLGALALVPAPREAVEGTGEYVVDPKVKYTLTDWYDFDRVGQALAEMKKTVTTDRTLPAEGYRLKVTRDGVEIAAADAAGEFYAAETLRQLATADGTNTVAFRCCEIRDWPQYRWRGMLIDEGRRFLGKEIVLKTLDTMAMHKLNVLHWHLTEDQGWRLELKRHPELVEYGAKRRCSVRFGAHATWKPPKYAMGYELNTDAYGPFFYTQDDVREILAYAKARHITVVPELCGFPSPHGEAPRSASRRARQLRAVGAGPWETVKFDIIARGYQGVNILQVEGDGQSIPHFSH